MEPEYRCIDCGHEITSAEYEDLDNIFCPECSGHIEEIIDETKTTDEQSNNFPEKYTLITCESCNHKFSQRASKCPKCEWVPTGICGICKNTIPLDSTSCPECGDPSPFFDQNTQIESNINNTVEVTLGVFEIYEGYSINGKMICPHCGKRGCVATKRTKAKKGISGAKATGAILTAGLSILTTGLSRKEWVTDAKCKNCGEQWQY